MRRLAALSVLVCTLVATACTPHSEDVPPLDDPTGSPLPIGGDPWPSDQTTIDKTASGAEPARPGTVVLTVDGTASDADVITWGTGGLSVQTARDQELPWSITVAEPPTVMTLLLQVDQDPGASGMITCTISRDGVTLASDSGPTGALCTATAVR